MWGGGTLQDIVNEYLTETDAEDITFDEGSYRIKKIGRLIQVSVYLSDEITFNLSAWEMRLLFTLPTKYLPLLNNVPAMIVKKERGSASNLCMLYLNFQPNGNVFLQNGNPSSVTFSGGGRVFMTYISKKP